MQNAHSADDAFLQLKLLLTRFPPGRSSQGRLLPQPSATAPRWPCTSRRPRRVLWRRFGPAHPPLRPQGRSGETALFTRLLCPAGPWPMAASTPDASHRRREKRRQLDARRSKCRIRLGGHMEQWCLLKERLGFSLHSQLAKFLLDRLGPDRGWGWGTQRPPSKVPAQYSFLLAHFLLQHYSL